MLTQYKQNHSTIPGPTELPHETIDKGVITEPNHIVFCCNTPFIRHVAVTVTSLLTNNSCRSFVVHLIVSDNNACELSKLRQTLRKFPNADLKIYEFDVDQQRTFFTDRHITAESYMRLYIADILDEHIRRVIYLDGDLVVCGNIDALCDLELNGALLAAVPDSNDAWRREMLNLTGSNHYVNAGMLVLDLDRWRRERCRTQIDAILDAYGDQLYFHDQDVLNILANGRILELGREWNFNVWRMRAYFAFDYSDIKRFAPLRNHAKIIHFGDYEKPWRFAAVVPLRGLYWHYQRQTAWPSRSEKSQLLSRAGLFPLKLLLNACYINPVNALDKISCSIKSIFQRLGWQLSRSAC